jgi:hypothetical protein
MRKSVLLFVAGLLVGELDPIGWGAWRLIATRLPAMKAESLAHPSPFASVPRARWLADSPRAYVIENDIEPIAPVHPSVAACSRRKVERSARAVAPPRRCPRFCSLAPTWNSCSSPRRSPTSCLAHSARTRRGAGREIDFLA